ncbi:MAG: hypothetical protein WCI30_05255 [Clostridia bacterium]
MKNISNKGAALAWVLMIFLVFSIIGTAGLVSSNAMFQRSIDNNSVQQAYFTAKSTVDLIASQLQNNTTFKAQVKSSSPAAAVVNIGFSSEMGSCSAIVTNEIQPLITATATVAGISKSLSALLVAGWENVATPTSIISKYIDQ